MFEKRDPFGS